MFLLTTCRYSNVINCLILLRVEERKGNLKLESTFSLEEMLCWGGSGFDDTILLCWIGRGLGKGKKRNRVSRVDSQTPNIFSLSIFCTALRYNHDSRPVIAFSLDSSNSAISKSHPKQKPRSMACLFLINASSCPNCRDQKTISSYHSFLITPFYVPKLLM